MKSKEAIRLLQEMKAELDSFTARGTGIPQDPPLYWTRKLHGYGDQFFEHGSDPHVMLTNTRLNLYGNAGNFHKEHEEVIIEAKSRIDHCIDFIQRFGLYRPPRRNMLESWSNGLIVLILTSIGAGTFLVGKYTSDVAAMELRHELKVLRDSLRIGANTQPAGIIHDTVWIELNSNQPLKYEPPNKVPTK